MVYEKGEYQKARIIEYIHDYHQQTKSYPRRREIAEALGFSLSYALQLIRQMAEEGTIKTQPPWDRKLKQWTVIVGLKRGAVPSAKRVLLSRRASTLLERTTTSSQN
jgi:SOS-response transcriptional repressor LexA